MKCLGIISIVLTYLWLYIYIFYGNNMVIDLHGGSSIFWPPCRHLDGIIRMSQLDGHGMGQAGHLHMVPSLGPSCLSSKYIYNIHIYIIYILYIYYIYIIYIPYIFIQYIYIYNYIYTYMGRCYTSIIHGCVIYISNISNIYSFFIKQN